jgi:lysylphosphatidylglycerol synthetase-like protein (DUF2156 family)
MPINRDNRRETMQRKVYLAAEILGVAAADKKFSDSDDLAIFNLGIAALNHMLIENRHDEAINQFIRLLRSNGDRYGS